MKHANSMLALTSSVMLCALTTSCGGSSGSSRVVEVVKKPGYNPNHGPFNSSGDYVEHWADKPPKRRYVRKKGASRKSSKPTVARAVPAPTQRSTTSRKSSSSSSRSTASRSSRASTSRSSTTRPTIARKPTQRPSAAVVKPKTKPPIRHVVRSGDTLYSLSRKYGTSVTAIQRANGISGTNIRTGGTLLIPRR